MKKTLLLWFLLFQINLCAFTRDIWVANLNELNRANKDAAPGDCIILRNGTWENVKIVLTGTGTKEQPIRIKAETPGQVRITGQSALRIGGSYLVVEGLYFVSGFSGGESVIQFRHTSDQIANNCRVTNTTILDFNNPKRLQDNYWIALYGKNNRVDHCSFVDKKNLGVLLAVILDDERSRENFHSIDHNYFGKRAPLASNAGEIIRVGVSEHCQFNSNTQIVDNYFEHCDGEGEIISIKSGQNVVRNNFFNECQGSVVLRHGNYNVIENNIFYGNNKIGTGGVRVINKGQWVVNNIFYKCRGWGFRAPLSIMNGIFNSPANRYVEVSEAVISNNLFFECSPMGFCEGSDAERTIQPHEVTFANNVFYNTTDSLLYFEFDDISRMQFSGNLVSNRIQQKLTGGFSKAALASPRNQPFPVSFNTKASPNKLPDSLIPLSKTKLAGSLSDVPGLSDTETIRSRFAQRATGQGANWYKPIPITQQQVTVRCQSTKDILQTLTKHKQDALTIVLTSDQYSFEQPLLIDQPLVITSSQNKPIRFSTTTGKAMAIFQQIAGSSLTLNKLLVNLESTSTSTLVQSDTSGSSEHSQFKMHQCIILNNPGRVFTAARTSIYDSIVISGSTFINGKGTSFQLIEETDNKGYYNVENLTITESKFTNQDGPVLAILRSGRDESTMGPKLIFSKNQLDNCQTRGDQALIDLKGIQLTLIENNRFNSCNKEKTIIQYTDWVRATHTLKNNTLIQSGRVNTNQYVRLIK